MELDFESSASTNFATEAKGLKKFSLDIKCVSCEVIEFFEEISKTYKIKNVLSYQEIGNNLSYSRDKKIAQFFRSKNINWIQNKTNGIIRGLSSRKNWKKRWIEEMKSEIVVTDLDSINKQKVKIPSKIKAFNSKHEFDKKLSTRWRILCLDVYKIFSKI